MTIILLRHAIVECFCLPINQNSLYSLLLHAVFFSLSMITAMSLLPSFTPWPSSPSVGRPCFNIQTVATRLLPLLLLPTGEKNDSPPDFQSRYAPQSERLSTGWEKKEVTSSSSLFTPLHSMQGAASLPPCLFMRDGDVLIHATLSSQPVECSSASVQR